MRNYLLSIGEPAPWFTGRCSTNDNFHLSSVAGRYVVLCFFQSASRPDSCKILYDILQVRSRFNDSDVCFFGVSVDPQDEKRTRVWEEIPGIRFFWDFDGAISRQCGAYQQQDGDEKYRPHTVVLDPLLRVVAVLEFDEAPESYVSRLLEILNAQPRLGPPTIAAVQAPVLVVPRVFEPELCLQLIELYEQHGGYDSGFMREVNGKTVGVIDYGHKRRRDYDIGDERVRRSCMVRVHDRLAPEIHKAFQFKATRMERYIVACYDSGEAAHFRAHRDNTTKGTAHRRFAVSLHLNTGEYEGGYLRFPEFGNQLYIAPAGGAVVFSCSLLHEATPVTRGKRYMFLPFLYDDEAARIRQENVQFLVSDESNRAIGSG